MAEFGKKGMIAIAPKAPLPPNGADSSRVEPLDAFTPIAAATADTDILNAAKGPSPSIADTRLGNIAAIHAVPTVGDRIGKYVVERMIGSGGMGLVVAARHDTSGELVAIKLLRPKAAGDKIHSERFAREARSMIKIKSEHVVRVLDASTLDSGAPYIVMEYLVGRDLAQILREGGPMSPQRAADLMLQVCEAVASAHAVGVIHRDLKPSNFFVTQHADGTTLVKVLDFGISKATGTDGVVDPNLTETQAVFGSPTYMSPEQIRSAKHVDHRSDIWSLGVGLYEIVTGKLPFAADNVAGLLASIVADPPFLPRGFAPRLPQELEDLLLTLLAKDPKQRVQSVADFAFRLASFASQNDETRALIEQIARLGNASVPAITESSGARRFPLPPPTSATRVDLGSLLSPPPTDGGASVDVVNPSQPIPPAPRSSGIAFSTGSDLLVLPRRGNTFVAVAIGLGIATLLIGGLGAYHFRTRDSAPTHVPAASRPEPTPSVVPAPTSTASSSASAPVSTPASTTTSATSTSHATPSTKPASSTPKRQVKHWPAKTPSTGAAVAPTTPKPVDPTNDRY